MATINVSLPESLREFVDAAVEDGHYGSSSEYICELIRRDQDRRDLRDALIEGGASPRVGPADSTYFDELRAQIRPA